MYAAMYTALAIRRLLWDNQRIRVPVSARARVIGLGSHPCLLWSWMVLFLSELFCALVSANSQATWDAPALLRAPRCYATRN